MQNRRNRAFDFLSVGVQKSGTTWLKQCLDQHPDIKSPLVKEVQFFSKLYLGVYYKGMAARHQERAMRKAAHFRSLNKHELADIYLKIAEGCENPDEDWYRTVFSVYRKNKFVGEYTPDYFCIGEDGVKHIQKINPVAKIIIIIRDPASRAISSISMGASRDNKRTAMQILRSNEIFWKRGMYSEFIPIWDRFFGDQVLYIPYGQIRSAPENVIKDVENHIGATRFSGYANLDKKWNSWTGKSELDPDVLKLIASKTPSEEHYLKSRFGSDFYRQTF